MRRFSPGLIAVLVTGTILAACGGGTSTGTNPVPAKLAFTVQPSPTAPNVAIAPAVKVAIQDANGTLVSSATDAVTLALGNAGGATLSGTLTVNAVGGIATFSNLSVDVAAVGYTLMATSGTLTGATSAAFTVAIPVPTSLAFTVQPTFTAPTAVITPAVKVAIRDQNGILVATATDAVTLALGNPGGATLSGTLTVNAVAGIATFGDLSVDLAGNGYTLIATATGLTDATSTPFTAAVAPATATVTVGPGIVFKSDHNGTSNAAVDSVSLSAGGGTATVTWTWAPSLQHSVLPTGTPPGPFTGSTIGVAPKNFSFGFTVAGDYTYECGFHLAAMTGVVHVLP